MAMPQSLRMSGKFAGVIGFLEMGVIFMWVVLMGLGFLGLGFLVIEVGSRLGYNSHSIHVFQTRVAAKDWKEKNDANG
jgi:hypothetical protein